MPKQNKALAKIEERIREAIELHTQGKIDEAEAIYREALLLLPDAIALWRNLGAIARKKGAYNAAVAFALRAIELEGNTKNGSMLGNLQNALIDMQRSEDFAPLLNLYREQALPNNPVDIHQKARVFRNINPPEALRMFAAAAKGEPGFEKSVDYAMTLLENGHLKEGFDAYEGRWDTDQLSKPKLDLPQWKGTPEEIKGKRILIFAEQGLGDTIFLSRYLCKLRELGAKSVQMVVRPQLVRYFEGLEEVDAVFNRDRGLSPSEIDLWTVGFDLAKYFLDTHVLPCPVPQLPEDSLKRAEALTKPFKSRKKIGITWATSPTGRMSQRKSIDFSRFLPLLEQPGLQLFSLYKGKDDDIIEREMLSNLIMDCGRSEKDLCDSAALISKLDLVISVDTAIAHLAGAMGTPVWMLTPEPPFWYWRGFGEQTPYYPSMRLLRQHKKGEWGGVFDRLYTDLVYFSRGLTAN